MIGFKFSEDQVKTYGGGRSVHSLPWCTAFLFGLLIFVIHPVPGNAQVTAAIVGRVQDASGAAISGANVTVTATDTGATRSVATDADGTFRALSLPLGPQEVKVEKQG